MEPQEWWNLFLETGAPEAYLAYRMQCRTTEVPDVSENQCAGAAGSGLSGCR